MDAVTIVISNSFINNKFIFILKMAITFGFFQFLMSFFGYYLGSSISFLLSFYQNLFSFVVFTLLGINILTANDSTVYIYNNINLFLLGFLTSIDAFSVGLTLSLLSSNILINSFIIGIITFILCLIGSIFSWIFVKLYPNLCRKFGGILMILLGLYYLIIYIKI